MKSPKPKAIQMNIQLPMDHENQCTFERMEDALAQYDPTILFYVGQWELSVDCEHDDLLQCAKAVDAELKILRSGGSK